MTKNLLVTSVIASLMAVSATSQIAYADAAKAKEWISGEFQPSTLDMDGQMAEMEWFIKAAEPFKGMEINV